MKRFIILLSMLLLIIVFTGCFNKAKQSSDYNEFKEYSLTDNGERIISLLSGTRI